MAAAAAAKPKTQVDALISRREDFSVKLLPRVPTTLCQLPIDPLALKGLGLLPSNIPMPPLAPRGPSPLLVETLQSNHARRTISRRNSGSYFAPSLNSGPRFSSAAPLPVPSFWAPRPVPQQLMKPSGGQQNTSSEPPQPPPASSTFHPQVVARGSAAKLVARVFHPLPPRPQLPLPKSQLPPLSAGAPVKPPAPTVTLASSLKATAPAFVPSGKVTSPTISHSSPKRFVVHQDVQASLTSKAPTLQVAPQPPLTPIMESTNGPLLTISPLAFVNTNTAKTRAHTSGMPNWAMAPSAAVTKPMPPPNVQPQKSHTTEKPNWAIASIGEKRLVADENVLPPRPVAKWRGRVGGRFGG